MERLVVVCVGVVVVCLTATVLAATPVAIYGLYTDSPECCCMEGK